MKRETKEAKKTNTKRYHKTNGSKKGRGKESEINIPDSAFNKEDLASIVKDGKIRGQNDPAWYANNPQLLRDAASFPFSWPVGSPVEYGYTAEAPVTSFINNDASVPGIMSFAFTPTIGYATNPTSPINIAARQIYSFVRHANSGHSNYDSPDLMMYLVAMDSAYAWLSYMTRVYGTAMLYSPVNRYLPKALLQAQNVDAEDVFENLAQLRFYINEFSYKIASMCVPAGMTYFTRHAWLSTNVYLDSQSAKAQMYLFYPVTYYVFREQVEGPGYLTARAADVVNQELSNLTVAQLVEIGKEILEPIISSEDFNIMSGDILKAFGSDNLMKVAPISEDYTVMPVYVPEVNSQIENMIAVGGLGAATSFGSAFPTKPGTCDITQDPNSGAIIQKLQTQIKYIFGGTVESPTLYNSGSSTFWKGKKKLNMHNDVVTPEMTMVASRLMASASVYTANDNNQWNFMYLTNYGSEVINYIRVYSIVDGIAQWTPSTPERHFINLIDTYAINAKVTTRVSDLATLCCKFAQFDWSPALRFFSQSGAAAADVTYCGDTFDTDNYTLIDNDSLYRMHETALLSMFSVPQMASIASKPSTTR